MASAPVREYIARRAHVSAEVLQIASPVTPEFPRPLATSGKKSTKDILKSTNQYRLSVQANPTVPILDIYAEAPTEAAAKQLANAAVTGMQDYLKDLGASQGTPAARQVRLEQLGQAQGGVINPGIRLKIGVISFVLVFAVSSATVLAVTRVRRGWKLEALAQRGAGTTA
jgi:hypothetical protein